MVAVVVFKEFMEELIDLWKGLALTGEENEGVQAGSDSRLLSADRVELCAVAKSVWRVHHGTQIDPAGDNIFII